MKDGLECDKRINESGSSGHHQGKLTKAGMAVLEVGGQHVSGGCTLPVHEV